MRIRKYLISILLIVSVLQVFAQVSRKDSLNPNRKKIIALPLVFFSPDTKFGGGAGGLLTFNFPKDSLNARRSSTTFGIAYTQLNQLLCYFPFQLFLKNQKYWLYGELGYYKYIYNYFGVGNFDNETYIEKYDAKFPHVRIYALQKIRPNIYVGFRYSFDQLSLKPKSDTSFLNNTDLLGRKGGRISGLGLVTNYDTRDKIFYPTKGVLLETSLYHENTYTGSDFRNSRISIDASAYFSTPNKRHIWAINSNIVLSNGEIPFHQKPFLGGPKKLRGYFERKYLDDNLLLLQTEYRFPLFWRLGGAIFAGGGTVASKINQFNVQNIRYSYGLGLRVLADKQQGINIRIDYGFGKKSQGLYLTVGEAF